jgi:ribose transport system ATP-binding protein
MKKNYGAVKALTDGRLEIRSGEVVALLGANGSGKSTLGKIITGITRPDAGVMLLNGRPVRFASPLDARRQGVTAVYQELSLVPDLTVAENIWLGHEPMRLGGLDRRSMRRRSARLLELFDGVLSVPVTPDLPVRDLPPSERQIVEILKALSREPRVLILDEATASLDSRQVDRLFELVGEWRAAGMAIAFVSHRMEEIFRVADRAVVLRSGATVGERSIAQVREAELVELMTGGATPLRFAGHAPEAGSVMLSLRNLRSGRVAGVDLEVRQGELVGLGGLQGQGQADLLLAIFGAVPHQGRMLLHGRPVTFRGPRQAMRAGVAYVPGDRAAEGLLPIRPILENLQLPGWARYGLPLRIREAERDAAKVAASLNIRFDSLAEPVHNLSGGNAQKVVIGKWLLRSPQLLLLNDPTKGIDVSAKAEFYALLTRLQEQGSTILFYSSDDDELLGLCQRVLVLHDGLVTAELTGASLDRRHLLAAAMGSPAAGAFAGDDAPDGRAAGGAA